MSRTKLALGGAFFLLLLFFVQGIFFIRANSQTIDEATHLAAGYSYLATRDFRLDPEHPSFIKELQALPLFLMYRLPFNPNPQQWRDGDSYRIGQDFLYKSIIPADQMLVWSRLSNLFLGALLVVLIGWWGYRLWGSLAAMLAMALASLEPNFVAHSSLVTTDIGVTLFIFLAVYLLWEYVNSPTWARLAATGICAGLAVVSKFSGLLLIPIIITIVVVLFIGGNRPVLLPLKENPKSLSNKLFESAAALLLIFFLAFLTIPPVYFFQGFATWLSGLQLLLNIMEEGRPAFFLGTYSYKGWWSYFLIVFLIKTPICTIALVFASLALYKAGSALRWREAVFLLAPVILFLRLQPNRSWLSVFATFFQCIRFCSFSPRGWQRFSSGAAGWPLFLSAQRLFLWAYLPFALRHTSLLTLMRSWEVQIEVTIISVTLISIGAKT